MANAEGALPASVTGETAGAAAPTTGATSSLADAAGGPGDAVDLASNASAPSGAPSAAGTPSATGPSSPSGIVDSNVTPDLANASSQADIAKSPIKGLLDTSGGPNVDVGKVTSNAVTDQSAAVKSPGGWQPDPMAADAAATPGAGNAQPSWAQQIGNFGKSAGGFISDNKELLNAGGGLVSGAMKSASDQSLLKEKYAAQTAYEQGNRDRLNASMRGLAMPTYQAPARRV